MKILKILVICFLVIIPFSFSNWYYSDYSDEDWNKINKITKNLILKIKSWDKVWYWIWKISKLEKMYLEKYNKSNSSSDFYKYKILSQVNKDLEKIKLQTSDYEIYIEQDWKRLEIQENTYKLKKSEFNIVVESKSDIYFGLYASFSWNLYENAIENRTLYINSYEEWHPFALWKSTAIEKNNPRKTLFLNESWHEILMDETYNYIERNWDYLLWKKTVNNFNLDMWVWKPYKEIKIDNVENNIYLVFLSSFSFWSIYDWMIELDRKAFKLEFID